PVITLNGASTINLTVGDSFSDPGATASDAEDSDLTGSITTSGLVDTGTIGTYTITYNVEDSGGLTDTETRTVNINAQEDDGGGNNGGSGGGSTPPGPTVGVAAGPNFTSGGSATVGEPQGEVLGAAVCSIEYLRDYLRQGMKNDSEQVTKLQEFLNKELGLSLPMTGFFGQLTRAAVEQFQVKHKGEVLKPWVPYGLESENTPTGYVYKTTKRWINMLECPDLNLPIPQLP
ncbi:MAG: immunoglobulin-like domain-containing protein, partial [Patescibacteria group bacterium]